MGASAPSAPLYLQSAIHAIERLLGERYPTSMTAREIAEELAARGFRWPLPGGYVRRADGLHPRGRDDTATPTADRVRRVCEMTGNKTSITTDDYDSRPRTYTIWDFAMPEIRDRIKRSKEARDGQQ